MRSWLLILLFAPLSALAGQSFLTTEPVDTPAGRVHLEVQTYEINTPADLENAKSEIQQADLKSGEVFRLDVRQDGKPVTRLERSASAALDQVAAGISSSSKLRPSGIKVFLQKHYNVTLAVVRLIANSATVSTGLIMGAGVSPEHALMIGALAGSMSGAIQLKSDLLLKWLANSVLLVNTAKRLGLLKSTEGAEPTRSEKILKEVETYGRWASLEAAFLVVVQTSMALLNIPVTENLLLTVGKSTASQGVFEVGVLKAVAQLEKMNPRWAGKTGAFKNVALFAGSGISVLAAIGSMIDMPFANLGFVTLTSTGLLFTFGPKVIKSAPVERILSAWKNLRSPPARPAVRSCRALLTS